MEIFLFKKIIYFFKRYVPSGFFLANGHLSILDGHDSYVTLEQTFQNIIKKKKDVVIPINNHRKPNKINLVRRVDKTLY